MMKKALVYLAVPILYVLHQDWWFWNDEEHRLFGMPIGLTYQALFCLAAATLMFCLVRYAWPAHLEVEATDMKPERPNAWH